MALPLPGGIDDLRANATGFTLVEALLALAIVGIGVLAVSGSLFSVGVGDQRNELQAVATMLAADKLEELLARPLEEVVAGTDQPATVGGMNFTRTWTVQVNVPLAGTRSLSVSVSHPDLNQAVVLRTVATEGI